jgi:predicted RNA methylase
MDNQSHKAQLDDRERKGAFYTPKIWVELSQRYIADVLGKDWQDEYYVWDCAAGTGNLLAGLTNKYHIWASTIDKADVDVMKDRIHNGANLLEDHVFQFDFLNDDFDKLPKSLLNVINDPKLRKKLIIYFNPPYADASSNMKTNQKAGNSFNKTHEKYKDKLGSSARELYAQFLIRIYFEIPDCRIAAFSTFKLLSVTHAEKMRRHFLAKLEKMFLIPAATFDNVKGHFPIGFNIWDTSIKEKFNKVKADIFDETAKGRGRKTIYSYDGKQKINQWITERNGKTGELGYIP